MKTATLALSLALFAAPSLASAQTAQAPQAPSAHGPSSQFLEQIHQMSILHDEARAAMLNALTPANRQLLANLAGTLWVAPTPDVDGAIAQLDNALSQAEKNAILAADANLRTQTQALHQQMMASGSMAPPAQHVQGTRPVHASGMTPPARTAGRVLFLTTGFRLNPPMPMRGM